LPSLVGNMDTNRMKVRSLLLLVGSLAAGIVGQGQSPAAPETHPASPSIGETATNPVANPGAVVVLGRARFTVLTPQLIRMEWAEDGKFEDHASLVFLNRNLPVPKFSKELSTDGHALTITTTDLTLAYTPSADGSFTAEDLSLSLQVDGKETIWHPGMADTENLKGTTRTLDGALGSKTAQEGIEPGLVSRSGWEITSVSRAASLFPRGLPSAPGGRASGHTAIRKSSISSTAFTRTTRLWMSL